MSEAPRHLPADARLLFATRCIRLFAYGALSVVLVFYLVALGLSEAQTGVLLTCTLVGDTVVSLLLTTRADRMGRRTTLMAALIHGVPVVTTVGRLSEPFWSSSPAVSAVPAGDVDRMVHAAVALATDAGRRQDQSVAARALYAARFDVAHVIAALREDRCEPLPAALSAMAE